MAQFKFYVQMDGMTFGPYSALEIRNLDLLDDIMVTEESMNGQWLPACRFDFDDMARKEFDSAPNPASSMPGQATMPFPQQQPYQQQPYQEQPYQEQPYQEQPYQQQPYQQSYQQQPYQQSYQEQPYQQSYQEQPYQQPYQAPERDDSVSKGLCVLGFFVPLVGWILYFVFRESKPKQAHAICKCAWIGAAVSLVFNIVLMIFEGLLS